MKKANTQLRHYRAEKGWSQRKLGELIGTDQNAVSRWERGKREASPYYREKLCNLFGKTATELGFIEAPPTEPPLQQGSERVIPQRSPLSAWDPADLSAPGSILPYTAVSDTQSVRDITSSLSIQSAAEQEEPLTQTTSQDIILREYDLGEQGLNKPRRQLIQDALGTGIVAITSSDVLFFPLILERFSRVLTKPVHIDESMLRYLETRTDQYWQDRHRAVVASSDLLVYVMEHLQRIITFLEKPLLPIERKRLCSLASGTAQLVGHLLFDLSDYTNARCFHKLAIKAAQEANNPALEAVAWGRMSFTWTYNGNARKALTCIQQARFLAKGGVNMTAQAYLAAIEAEIQAILGEREACQAALGDAEFVTQSSEDEENNYWLRFDRSRLAGYQGTCFRRLYNPQDSQTVHFLSEAQKALQDALGRLAPSMIQRRPALLLDAAHIYTQQGEIVAACEYAAQAITIISQIKSKAVMKRLLTLRKDMKNWEDTQYVKGLDECIESLTE